MYKISSTVANEEGKGRGWRGAIACLRISMGQLIAGLVFLEERDCLCGSPVQQGCEVSHQREDVLVSMDDCSRWVPSCLLLQKRSSGTQPRMYQTCQSLMHE